MRKKGLWLLALLPVAIGLAALIPRTAASAGDIKLNVVASVPLLKDFVERIGGDAVTVTSIVKTNSCCHEYEPSAGDMKQVATCDLYVKGGLGFDTWADKLLTAGGGRIKVLDSSQGVAALEDDVQNDLPNPHYWWNPDNAVQMAENIADGLSEAMPARKEYFAANRDAFVSEIGQTAERLRAEVDELGDKQIVSYSAAFTYLYDYFGFQNLIAVQSVCEELEVSPQRLAKAVAIARSNKVKAVVGEAVDPKDPVALAQETGAELVLLWPTTNESGSYLGTLSDNVGRLVAALK